MKVDFIKAPISAAIRTDKDFSAALRSQVDMVFLLHASINTVKPCVKEIHSAGKKAFIHVDFAEGIGKDRAGAAYSPQRAPRGRWRRVSTASHPHQSVAGERRGACQSSSD